MSASVAFDHFGQVYDPSQIILDGTFSVEAYRNYSPAFIPITLALAYGISFASLTGVAVHTFLWYRHDIARQFRLSLKDRRDVHSRLMSVYQEVPHWWFAVIGILAFVFSIVTVEVWDTKLPIWGVILAVAIGFVFLIPVGLIQAITNQQIGLK